MKHVLASRIQRQGSGQQKEQGQEPLSNSSLSMLIFWCCLPCNRRHQGINSANHEYGCDKHLLLIAQKVPKGRYALTVLDDVAWHQAHLTEKFDNLSIIKLPPLFT
jgi:hypothetical protein